MQAPTQEQIKEVLTEQCPNKESCETLKKELEDLKKQYYALATQANTIQIERNALMAAMVELYKGIK